MSAEPIAVNELVALGWAKATAWHKYGIAWRHLERESQSEIMAEALVALAKETRNE